MVRPDGAAVGLSPRVRGNPTPNTEYIYGNRSIPACAGEPILWQTIGTRRRVYPRVCGGTPAVNALN